MRVSFAVIATGLVAVVSAQQSSGANPFKIPTPGYLLKAGSPTTFNWTPTTSGTVTLQLRDGANGDLNTGTVIQSGIPNTGSYTYTPPSDIVEGNSYTIEIIDDSDPTQVNYTPQFDILSPVKAVPSSASASASVSAASSTASGSSASSAAASSSTLATITSTASSTTESASTTGTDSSATVATTRSSSGTASSTVSGSTTRSSGASTTASSSPSGSTSAGASAATTSVTSTNGVESIRVGTGMLVVAIGVAVAVL